MIRRVASRASAAIFEHGPLALALRGAGLPLLAPLYHLVAEHPPAHVKHLFSVRRPQTFSDDLDFFLRTCQPVDLEQLHSHALGQSPLPLRAMHLSFDDGMREVVEVVAPMLSRRGVPATFFLNSAFVDNKSLFYRHKASLLCSRIDEMTPAGVESLRSDLELALGAPMTDVGSLKEQILAVRYIGRARLDALAAVLEVDFDAFLREKRPYLTSDEITGLLRQGFAIGSHSVDHPKYAEIDLGEQMRQTRQSMTFLTDRFAVSCRGFAFPFDSAGVDKQFYDAVYQQEVVDMLFCLNGIDRDNPRNVERVWMEIDSTTPARRIVKRFCFNQWRGRT